MHLAIWSPAVCCCGVKAAMGEVTGVDVAACGELAPPADKQPAETIGCCGGRGAPVELSAASCHALRPASTNHGSSPCRCHETVESKARIDTGVKVSIPALVQIDNLPAMLPVAMPMTMAPSVAEGVADNRRRSDLPARQKTLVAQRCLLLI
jgi:hypothetical protein